MAYNKSKAKGTAFEAKIVKILNSEFSNIQFERVPLSGAISYLKGDIWTPHDTAVWPWCIEAKHYKEVNWNSLLTAKSADMFTFWEQATREAEIMKKKPLLIFRWDRSKDYVAYDDDIEIKDYIEVSSFNHKFKIALFTDWIVAIKKQTNLAKV